MRRLNICIKKMFAILVIPFIAYSCSWENEETLYPEDLICDTLDVSYASDVVPILTSNCYACHSNANAPDFGSGNTFEDYDDAAASSHLIVGAINHRAGFPAMPRNADMLDTCSIDIIEAWVNDGSPDN
jgi:hypothetical protein